MSERLEGIFELYNDSLGDLFESLEEGAIIDAQERARKFVINKANLDEEVQVQPAMLQYVGTLLRHAKEKEAKEYLDLKVVKAQTHMEFKGTGVVIGNSKTATVQDLEALVQNDGQVILQTANHIVAQSLVNQLQIDFESLKQRADMLKLLKAEIERERNLKPGL
jgi:ribosomal protein L21E